MLSVSETTIRRWLAEGKIPAYRLNKQYRFSRAEIENWVMSQRMGVETKALPFAKNDDVEEMPSAGGMMQYSLYRAINKGGVFHDVPGDTKEEVIHATMQLLAKNLDLDAEVLTDLLLDRERLMPTALNNGIAVPHTRDFILGGHHDAVAVVTPQKPIDYGALDGKPVHTMFFLFACEDRRHLHLLAKLAHMSSDEKAQELMMSRPNKKELLAYIRELEKNIQ